MGGFPINFTNINDRSFPNDLHLKSLQFFRFGKKNSKHTHHHTPFYHSPVENAGSHWRSALPVSPFFKKKPTKDGSFNLLPPESLFNQASFSYNSLSLLKSYQGPSGYQGVCFVFLFFPPKSLKNSCDVRKDSTFGRLTGTSFDASGMDRKCQIFR